MIEEVRRQFREKPGIMKGTEKPDYKSCVAISTTAALHEMMLPGIMAVVVPVIVGVVLGVEALGGLLSGALVTGVLMAIFMSNAGVHGIMQRNILRQVITAEKAARRTKQPLSAIQSAIRSKIHQDLPLTS
mgnify:FL=1